MTRRLRAGWPSPALILSAAALFFAVGGSAFAVGQHSGVASRCGAGAIKGFAVVKGDPHQGIVNLPETYSSAAALFGARYNCSGQAVEVHKLAGVTGYSVRFRGVKVAAATAAVVGNLPGAASVNTQPDGSIQVITAGNQPDAPQGTGGQFIRRVDLPFVVVVY
jgi:hypothetical protein